MAETLSNTEQPTRCWVPKGVLEDLTNVAVAAACSTILINSAVWQLALLSNTAAVKHISVENRRAASSSWPH